MAVLAPSGEETDSDIEIGAGSASGTLNAFLCENLDGAGRYDIRVQIDVYNDSYDIVSSRATTTSFSLYRSTSRVTVRASDRAIDRGDVLTLRGRVTAKSGPYAGRPVASESIRLQQWHKGRWRKVSNGYGYTSKYGRYRIRGAVPSRKNVIRLRVRFAGNEVFTGSQSKRVRIRVRQ
jgi:hypothetical protein